ncbi:hypothetical protein KAZ66_02580 [Candidatus Woesebacteria bacterium]|nr:hypothetical protein [Candidatus Woesebacteria bacterium]
MKPHFYSHVIEIDSIHNSLDELGLETQEKHELIIIVESSIHHVVMDTVLSELSERDKKLFLGHVVSKEHEKIWDLISMKIENVESKIKHAVENFKQKLHEDIKETKKKSKSV